MKPETKAAKAIEFNDDEKTVLKIIQKAERIDLNELKTQSGLSIKNGI